MNEARVLQIVFWLLLVVVAIFLWAVAIFSWVTGNGELALLLLVALIAVILTVDFVLKGVQRIFHGG